MQSTTCISTPARRQRARLLAFALLAAAAIGGALLCSCGSTASVAWTTPQGVGFAVSSDGKSVTGSISAPIRRAQPVSRP